MPVALATGKERTSESKIFMVHEGPADHLLWPGQWSHSGQGGGHTVARAVVTLWLEQWSHSGQGRDHSGARTVLTLARAVDTQWLEHWSHGGWSSGHTVARVVVMQWPGSGHTVSRAETGRAHV